MRLGIRAVRVPERREKKEREQPLWLMTARVPDVMLGFGELEELDWLMKLGFKL